jgi:beta-lactamase regulating signal transducer with metallopeptidase domain
MTALTLATLALRITVILGAVGVVNSVRRRSSAGSRHWLWMLALAGVSILPLTASFTRPLRVVPWDRPIEAATLSTDAPTTSPVSEVVSDERNVPSAASPAIPDLPIASIEAARTSIDIPTAIVAAWIFGTLLLIGRLLRAHVVARRVLRNSYITRQPSIESVPVRFSAEVELPFTYGLVKPMIILPADADTWSASQMKATLTHEVAHAKRGDGVALLVSQCIVALYWWHPVVWVAARAAAADRERACDDAVLREGMRASDYGQCLLAHADTVSAWRSKPLATVMFGHSAGIGARVAALLDPAIDRSSAARPKFGVVAGILGLVVLVGAAAPRELKRVTNGSPIQAAAQTELPLVSASIVPVAPAAFVAKRSDAEPTLCRQAQDWRQARTYKDTAVHITGAGAEYANGITREIWTGLDCIAWMEFDDKVDASTDEKTMTVPPGSRFIAHNEGPDGTREYRLTGGSSSLTLNGQTANIGLAEQQWIAGMTREFLRRTGKRVHERSRAALAAGGLPALLAEAARVQRSDVRAEYLVEGFGVTRDPGAVAKFIEEGSALLDSSTSRGRFLLAVPEAYRNNVGVLASIYREASLIEPDGDAEKVLASTTPPRPLPSVLEPWLERIIDGLQVSERRTALRAYYMGMRP